MGNRGSDRCGSDIVEASKLLCEFLYLRCSRADHVFRIFCQAGDIDFQFPVIEIRLFFGSRIFGRRFVLPASFWSKISVIVNYIFRYFSFPPSSYMVDAADHDKMEPARNELHNLLDKPQLAGIPVLVLGNKRDLPGALDEQKLIERL